MTSDRETPEDSDQGGTDTAVEFPMGDTDEAYFHELATLLRERLPKLNPGEILTISILILALERLPRVTPGVDISLDLGFREHENARSWINIEISEDELRVGSGEHIYTPGVGGDTESRTDFESCSGGTWYDGDMYHWIEQAAGYVPEGKISLVNSSDYDAVMTLIEELYELS